MSGLINKAKDAMHGGNSTSTTHTTTSTTHHNTNNNSGLPEGAVGPHGNRAENALDPRVDSDLDSNRHQTGGLGSSNHNQTSGLNSTGQHGLGSSNYNQTSGLSSTGAAHSNNPLSHNTTTQQSHNPLSGSSHAVGTHSHGTGIGGTPYNTTGGSSHQSHIPASGLNTHSGQTTAGVHRSDNLNKLDPTIDSDLSGGNHLGAQSDSRTAGLSGTGSSGVGSGKTFPSHEIGNTGVHTGNTGLGHSSTIGNQSNVGHSSHVGGSGLTGSHGHNNSSGLGSSTHNNTTTTAGAHSSNLLNRGDPTIDSDLSGGRHMGLESDSRSAGYSGAGTTGTSGLTGSSHNTGVGHSTGTSGLTGSSHNTGVGHSTGTSGLTGSNHTGTSGLTGSSHNTHGGVSHSSNAGPHSSNAANAADPLVDSDRSGGKVGGVQHDLSAAAHGNPAAVGSGNAPKTAGPHNSDLLNKLDPRVDSDLSGGKTYGGNKTNA